MPTLLRKNLYMLFLTGMFFVLITGCHTPANNSNNSVSNNSLMSAYIASVKPLKLPFTDTCYDTIPVQRGVFIPDSLAKFKGYGQLLGKVFENSINTGILYSIAGDVQVPVLHIFDKNGKEISSLSLFIGNCCGDDEACSGISTVEITKDLHIILKDSTQTFQRDKSNSDKKRNIKTIKELKEFKIDSTGKIINVQ